MKKQNSFYGEVTIKKSGYQNKSVKGATGYTLPTKPQQAYSMMKQQIDKQISSEIIFIPFPQIRNAIVSFMKPYPFIEKDQSQILTSEYNQNKKLKIIDNAMTQRISKGYHQKVKIQSIRKCFQKANSLKNDVQKLKNNLRKARQDQLQDQIDQIRKDGRKKQSKANKPQSQQFEQIQQQNNQKIMQVLMRHAEAYQKFNDDFINLDSVYAQIKQFCQQMQKLIPIVWRFESVPQSKQDMLAQNFIDYFKKTINQLSIELQGFIHQSQGWLQLYRNKVKSRSWGNEDKNELSINNNNNINNNYNSQQLKYYQIKLQQLILFYQQIQLKIKLQIYQKLKQITKLDQHIVRNLQSQINTNIKNYQKFVQTYTDIKQLSNTKNHMQDLQRIISDQQRYLSDHLRINCGLIVYYKPTKMFQEFANAIVKRTYVLQIFNNRLSPIRNALKFINQQYSDMYKKACQDPNRRGRLSKNQVKKTLNTFEKNLEYLQGLQRYKNNNERKNQKVYSQYLTHLILSLNRLMSLASD